MNFTTKIPEHDGYYWFLTTDWPVPFPAYFDGRGWKGKFYCGTYEVDANLLDKLRYRVGDRIEVPKVESMY